MSVDATKQIKALKYQTSGGLDNNQITNTK